MSCLAPLMIVWRLKRTDFHLFIDPLTAEPLIWSGCNVQVILQLLFIQDVARRRIASADQVSQPISWKEGRLEQAQSELFSVSHGPPPFSGFGTTTNSSAFPCVHPTLNLQFHRMPTVAGPLQAWPADSHVPSHLQSLNLGHLHLWSAESRGVSSSGKAKCVLKF